MLNLIKSSFGQFILDTYSAQVTRINFYMKVTSVDKISKQVQ